jgi:hypothetical protein
MRFIFAIDDNYPNSLLSRFGSRLGYSPAKLMLFLVHSYTEALHYITLITSCLSVQLADRISGKESKRWRAMVQHAKDRTHARVATRPTTS